MSRRRPRLPSVLILGKQEFPIEYRESHPHLLHYLPDPAYVAEIRPGFVPEAAWAFTPYLAFARLRDRLQRETGVKASWRYGSPTWVGKVNHY